jgi:hypothetical protein
LRRAGVEWLAVIAAAVVLIVLLFVKPVAGIADNGDFQRIMGTVGLEYMDPAITFADKHFGYFIREFRMKDVGLGGYVSTSLVLVFAAKGLSWLLNGGLFDMRYLALVYSLLFVFAAWLLIRCNKRNSPITNVLLAGLFVFIFADIGYAAYYNSLFSEPVAFVFLFLTLGFAAAMVRREEPTYGLLTGFFVSAVFLIGAKVQNAPIGILLTLLCLRFSVLKGEYRWRRRIRWYAAFLFIASVAIYFSLPKEIKIINEYQTVFYGVLKGSATPEEDLRELGLPERLAANAGTNYFEKAPIDQKDPIFEAEYHPNFSHMKVALFYMKHPVRFYHKLEAAAENGLTIRSYYLGNYEKGVGKPYGAVSYAFSGWSEFKHKVLPNKLWFIGLVFICYYGVLIVRYLRTEGSRERIYLELLALIGFLGIFQFLTPVIGDGEADLAKHLFGFNVSFDLMLWVSAVWLVERIIELTRIDRNTRY